MSPAYQKFQQALTELLEEGYTLNEAVQLVNQQYGYLADRSAQDLLEKQALEKALRNCQRSLRSMS
jgi:type II secretory pathway component PulF